MTHLCPIIRLSDVHGASYISIKKDINYLVKSQNIKSPFFLKSQIFYSQILNQISNHIFHTRFSYVVGRPVRCLVKPLDRNETAGQSSYISDI